MNPEASLSMLIHAPSKVGKSTLSSTGPTPALVLDAEGGWRFIREQGFKTGKTLRRINWDGVAAPPRYDGTWDVCLVTVQRWDTMRRVYDWLMTGQHDFKTLVLDSITEVQRRCKSNIRGDGQMQIQDWGALLSQMDNVIRGFRDLTLMPNNVKVAIFLAETREDKGKHGPYMQGQISVSLPYWMDLVGYLYVDAALDENGQPTKKVRKLLVGPHPSFVTGERVQGMVPDIIEDPNISNIIDMVFPEDEAQAEGNTA